jgi:hypothetical protein
VVLVFYYQPIYMAPVAMCGILMVGKQVNELLGRAAEDKQCCQP